jgi:SOS-response transcriptional repressor LexA
MYLQRRSELVDFVRGYIEENGFTPSPTILSQALGWPRSTCQGYLKQLRKEIPLPGASSSYQSNFDKNRKHLLQLIRAFSSQHGYAPSLRWLAGESNLSPTTLHKYLRSMREAGLIDFNEGVLRSIRERDTCLHSASH